MKVGFIYTDILGKGGYPRDIRWLASALTSHGVRVVLFCRFVKDSRVTEGLSEEVQIEPLDNLGRSKVDLYHLFGIFIPDQLWRLRQLMRKPLVVSPMGHLMPYHLRRKALKKALYLRLVKPVLRRVRWFHVFSDIEGASVVHYLGDGVRTFEAGLGVFPAPSNAGNAKRNIEQGDGLTRLLFFGRNDIYQKGLDILLKGYVRAVQRGVSVTLTIAGQPWGDSERYIREFVNREKIDKAIQVIGPVDEATKWKLLNETDYLMFLSRWDGPPRPIREAIAVGTPVIVSPETNMGGMVSEFRAGIQVELNPERVAEAILQVSRNRSLQKEHRQGVVKLRERLSWQRVAEDYIQGYSQVLESWQ